MGVINEKDERLFGKRIDIRIENVLEALKPFETSLKGVVVESTLQSWYWLVDGLQEHG